MAREYFARAPREEIAKEVLNKWSEYHDWLKRSGYGQMIQDLYDQYFAFDKKGGFKITKREDGAISDIDVNHFKNLLQRLHTLATQAKLTFVPRARNSDAKSQLQSDFTRGLLEYYGDEKHMHSVLSEAVERALFMLEVFIYCPWDENVGEPVAPDGSGREILQGDQAYMVFSAFDVARNTRLKKSPWHIIRERVNRYDLAAQHPEYAEEILNASDISNEPYEKLQTPFDSWQQDDADEETVYKYTFIHDKTKAMPSGRVTVICGNCCLDDSAMYYKRVPVVRLSAGDCYETVAGDSPATSLFALQQGISALFTAVTTNNLNGAMQTIWSQTENVDIKQISKGQTLITSPTKPEAINLVGSADETYKLIDNMVDSQQLLSGVNSTTRGNPEANIKNNGSMALMLAQAIQFVNKLQENYAAAAGDVATITVENLQSFCSEPKLAYIGGVTRKSYVREFTAKDIESITRVSVDMGNPMTQTIAGRYELIQQWQQNGVVKDPKQIINFLRTGEVDSVTENDFRDSISIREENEQLRKGINPPVVMWDMHPAHFLDHRSLASDPEFRSNPQLMEALTAHQQAHIDQMRAMPPDIAAMLGIPPLPSMQMGPPPPAPGQGEPPPPEIQGTPMPQPPEGTPPQVQEAYDQEIAAMENLTQPA